MMKNWVPLSGLILAVSGVVLAQSPPRPRPSIAPGTELQATLTKAVDVRRVKTGDEVDATLEQDVQGEGRVVLPQGTRLVGHVTEVRQRGKRPDSVQATNDSRLGLVFEKAVLDDGRQVPVVATIQAVASSEAAAADAARSADSSRGTPFGSGRVVPGEAGGGLAQGLPGSDGGVLDGVGSASGDRDGGRTSRGASTRSSAGAAGGLTPGGRLLSGSRGVFGINNLDIEFGGSARSGVLVSRATNVELPRGTRMLLISG